MSHSDAEVFTKWVVPPSPFHKEEDGTDEYAIVGPDELAYDKPVRWQYESQNLDQPSYMRISVGSVTTLPHKTLSDTTGHASHVEHGPAGESMNQNRRDLLRTLAVVGGIGLAGCGTRGQETTEEPPAESTSPAGSHSEVLPSTRTIIDSSPERSTIDSSVSSSTATRPIPPNSIPFQFNMGMKISHPTSRDPPTLRVEITNTGDERHSLSKMEWTFPLTPMIGSNGDRLILILDTTSSAAETNTPDRRQNGCWRANHRSVFTRPLTNGKSFQPGETLTREYVILTAPGEQNEETIDRCWPTGTYALSERYWLDSSDVGSMDGQPLLWKFNIEITHDSSVYIDRDSVWMRVTQ